VAGGSVIDHSPETMLGYEPVIWPRVARNQRTNLTLETIMANEKGPNVKKKAKCKNCEGKGLVKKGDKVVKCQRCHGTGLR
jgi:DnaJ-class molecular chaperone